MDILIYLIILICGITIGMILTPFLKLIDLEAINQLLDAFARVALKPFSLIAHFFKKKSDYSSAEQNLAEEDVKKVDPREQQISDSAQTIRSILLTLATAINRTDKAANDSNQALGDVRSTIDRMNIPVDLKEAHSTLMKEIDRVISTNSSLKGELASSQEILAVQRQQIEKLQTAVRIDGLTQLANRAYFDEKMTEMIRLFQRYNDSFCLMMIDVDNFKEINDAYGHPGGDRILKGVTYKIKEALRGSDFLARYGGDEFAVILIKTNARAATDVAWKLCTTLRESRFLLDENPVNVTLSIGVAEAGPNDTEETLIKRADKALYRVKEVGRNNVMFAETE
jgi:diguanylate cyclase